MITLADGQQIKKQDISDLLCSALEGGSNYWYSITKFVEPTSGRAAMEFRSDANVIYRHLDYPLNPGGALHIRAKGADPKKFNILNLDSIKTGLETMKAKYPNHFHDFMDDEGVRADAITGDVFLQCCLFGDIVYG